MRGGDDDEQWWQRAGAPARAAKPTIWPIRSLVLHVGSGSRRSGHRADRARSRLGVCTRIGPAGAWAGAEHRRRRSACIRRGRSLGGSPATVCLISRAASDANQSRRTELSTPSLTPTLSAAVVPSLPQHTDRVPPAHAPGAQGGLQPSEGVSFAPAPQSGQCRWPCCWRTRLAGGATMAISPSRVTWTGSGGRGGARQWLIGVLLAAELADVALERQSDDPVYEEAQASFG